MDIGMGAGMGMSMDGIMGCDINMGTSSSMRTGIITWPSRGAGTGIGMDAGARALTGIGTGSVTITVTGFLTGTGFVAGTGFVDESNVRKGFVALTSTQTQA